MTFNSAMIFAAGFGTRMGELTETTPKPMLEVAGRPMIDHAIDLLHEAGIWNILANTHYLPDELEAHLAQRGVVALRENPILETGGGLKAALPFLDEGPVITINPDAIWLGDNPVTTLIEEWKPTMTGLLMLVDTGQPTSDFSLEQGEIRRVGPYRYTGLQAIRTDRLSEIDAKRFSLNRYWDHLIDKEQLHGAVYPGEWLDIGTRDALEDANRRFSE